MAVSLIKCHKVSGQFSKDLNLFKLSHMSMACVIMAFGPGSEYHYDISKIQLGLLATWRLPGIIIWKSSSKEKKTKTAYPLLRNSPRTCTILIFHVSLLLEPVYMAMTKSKESWKSGLLYSVTVTQLSFKSLNNKFYILLH